MTSMLHRCGVLAAVVLASLVTISVARADFTSAASAGSQALTSASLSAPGTLRFTCSNGAVALTWGMSPSTFAAGYEILRGTASGGPYTRRGTVNGRGTTSFGDGGFNGTSKYYYVVRATKGQWLSSFAGPVVVDSSSC